MTRRRQLLPLAAAFAALALPALGQRNGMTIDRDILTVTTDQMQAIFRGPDLFRLINRLTGEQYLYPDLPFRTSAEMGMLNPPRTVMQGLFWHPGRNGMAAQWVENDAERTLYIDIEVDGDTQDISLTEFAAYAEGPTHLAWGLRGLDLTGGSLIIPGEGGRCLDDAAHIDKLNLAYPSEWNANMVIWQGRHNGGFVIYSRENPDHFKDLRLSRKGPRADIQFVAEPEGPFEKAGSIPQIEWRINMYKGDWRVPAGGYRDVMHFHKSPIGMGATKVWAASVRAVASLPGTSFDPKLADGIAKRLDGKKTLLILPDWRKEGYDPNRADYTARDGVKAFMDHAHELGFHVMLPLQPPGWNEKSSDFDAVKKFLRKDVVHGDTTVPPAPTFAAFDTASPKYRDLLIIRIRTMLDDVTPDAILLPGIGSTLNGGNGVIEKNNPLQGAAALCHALVQSFPGIALASDCVNEMLDPYLAFAIVRPEGPLSPHPISTGIFGDVNLYGEAPSADAAPGEFTQVYGVFEREGVRPIIVVRNTAELDAPGPGLDRELRVARLWQDHDLMPDWKGDWTKNGTAASFRWIGTDGTIADVSAAGGETKLTIGTETMYRRTQGAPTLATSLYIPGWPAYDDGSLFGLDPARDYWLEKEPRPAAAPHLSLIGAGASVAGEEITPSYAVFELAPARAQDAAVKVDATVALPAGTAPVGYVGAVKPNTDTAGQAKFAAQPLPAVCGSLLKPADPVTLPAALGAAQCAVTSMAGGLPEPVTSSSGSAACGGAHKDQALIASVPAHGRTVWTWYVKLPDGGKPTLNLSSGLADGWSGDGVALSVRVNGETVWTNAVKESAWSAASAELSRWAGQNALIQLVAVAAGDRPVTGVCWAEVALK